jgi:hypothetical protein
VLHPPFGGKSCDICHKLLEGAKGKKSS